ncbi:MAG: glycosyltransferase family 4 protein [Armatimonadota bacterium]
MPEKIHILHILRSRDAFVRDQIISLVGRLPRRHFTITVAGDHTRLVKRQLDVRKTRWIDMPLPATTSVSEQLAAGRRLKRVLASNPVSLMHAHGFQAAFTALGSRMLGGPHVPVIFSPHGPPGMQNRTPLQRRAVSSAARWVMQNVDRVAVQSGWELAQLQPIGLPKTEKTRLVPQGAAVKALRADFEPGAKRRLVGLDPQAAIIGICVGPEATGFRTFLRAANAISQITPNVEFVSLGEHGKSSDMSELAHTLGLTGSMVFLGDRADVAEIIASLNALVIPADFMGGTGYALQALANNIPLVVGETGPLADDIEQISSAYIVPAGDLKALKDIFHRILERVPGTAGEEFIIEELSITSREAMVERSTINLDTKGLDPEEETDAASEGAAVRRVIDAHSMEKMVIRYVRMYDELVQVPVPQRQTVSG